MEIAKHAEPFNSRPHAEVDLSDGAPGKVLFSFNSRPHAEVDQNESSYEIPGKSFNSRPHAEVDRPGSPAFCTALLSTHDLTQRSTTSTTVKATHARAFNSRPHAEVDILSLYRLEDWTVFQLTTSRRGRQQAGNRHGVCQILSTHDLTQRSTGDSSRRFSQVWAFQLTTSRRGRHTITSAD